MKREFIRLGHYTKLYKLEGGNRKDRYISYNDILFTNIRDITELSQQVIVLNEEMTGGVVYGNGKYSKIAFEKLQDHLKKYKLYIITRVDKSGYSKISFSIKKKEVHGWDKLNKF